MFDFIGFFTTIVHHVKNGGSLILQMFVYVFQPLATFVLERFWNIVWFIKFIGLILIEIIKPIIHTFQNIYILIKILIKFVLHGPFIIISSTYLMIKDTFSTIGLFFRSIVPSFSAARKIVPAAKGTVENKNAAKSLIQFCTQMTFYWSQSLINKIIKAAKSVYDFVIYVTGEISKHKHTLYLTIYDWSSRVWIKMKSIC